ncbi:hypothetical protein GCM10025789_07760 [Tessaracoccus lubricantis]|uniref:Uncharacterized protein n=1 Tax=Tessaracoccus lubricantis TaxID=545543 RepID=A0ABP9F5F0_9ACTN
MGVAGEHPRGAEEVATTVGDERFDALHGHLLTLTTRWGSREVVMEKRSVGLGGAGRGGQGGAGRGIGIGPGRVKLCSKSAAQLNNARLGAALPGWAE